MEQIAAPSLSETTEYVVLGRCKSEETVAYWKQFTDMYVYRRVVEKSETSGNLTDVLVGT